MLFKWHAKTAQKNTKKHNRFKMMREDILLLVKAQARAGKSMIHYPLDVDYRKCPVVAKLQRYLVDKKGYRVRFNGGCFEICWTNP